MSYAQGELNYLPPQNGSPPKIPAFPARLASDPEEITQQFSDRLTPLPAVGSSSAVLQNFAASIEDKLTMTLTANPAVLVITSTRYNFSVELALKDDPTTGVTIGDANGWSYIVMFGDVEILTPIQ